MKPRGPFSVGGQLYGLPQLSCCGPIEAFGRSLCSWCGCASFRNYHVAAPLKRLQIARTAREPTTLPQLSCCGPIEAWRGAAAASGHPAFRNYHVAAPLKLPSSIRAPAKLILPQLSCCGPIEAHRPDSVSNGRPAFRNYHVAAPLKLLGHDCIRRLAQTFRNYHVAAPLKPRTGMALSATTNLPQLSCCGPIEART